MAQISPTASLASAVARIASEAPSATVWIQDGQLVFGAYPKVEAMFDFGQERLVRTGGFAPPTPARMPTLDVVGGRKTGDYWIIVRGVRTTYPSGKAALMAGLRDIESISPGTLEKLEAYKPRTKRVVARKPELLYENPDLVAKFTAELAPGWFVATNNSLPEITKYLKKAAELANLEWASDFEFRFNVSH